MRFSTGIVDQALAPARAFDGLELGALDRGELLAAHQAVIAVRRASELLLASLAAEIDRRSAGVDGAMGLARAEGFASAPRLIAHATGGSLADAHRLIAAGAALLEPGALLEATPGGTTEPGTTGPAVTIAQALAACEIGVEAAALLRETLAKIPDDGTLEARLVAKARELPVYDLRRVCVRMEATHDAVAWREREKRQYDARFATMVPDRDGMMLLTARLDPPSAAPVKAWLDAQVRDAFRRRRDDDDPGVVGAVETSVADTRTAGQIRADALVSLARHGLGCDEPTSGVSTTVVVRIGLDDLRTGLGLGESDEISAPLSAAAIRCMAADAEIIPLVLGGASEPLELGRSRRLFSKAQRLALVERDGGCSWCHAPPSYCEAHHIRWWERDNGKTDLANGLLLCTSCHHRLHDAGWDVTVRDNKVWFVPPASVDPARKPRLGGRARLEGEGSAPPVEVRNRELIGVS